MWKRFMKYLKWKVLCKESVYLTGSKDMGWNVWA